MNWPSVILVLFLSGCGVHYNCTDLKTIPPDNSNTQIEWFEYCMVDPMNDFTKNKWGEHFDWKTGGYVR